MAVLEIRNLNKRFGRKAVLSDLAFSFEHGVYGLLGPNGAGKTTLMRCLTTVYPVERGTVFYHGRDIRGASGYLAKVGYLPQKFGLFRELRVIDMMLMMANLKGVEKSRALPDVERCLEEVNLSDRLDSKVGSLSGGMIRRLGIAQALIDEPEIVFLDEPTSGLDPEERLRFKQLIASIRENRTIIISTHIVEDVEALCDQIGIFTDQGIGVSGTCREIEQYAQGKVYELPMEELPLVQGKYHVQNQYERGGEKLVKILTAQAQDLTPVQPQVEDGYICILKGI